MQFSNQDLIKTLNYPKTMIEKLKIKLQFSLRENASKESSK